ncbi:hypothetical protein SBOR_6452 [Sclerotinia borealis F-4128]|uniref:TNT domain-containing protein n=1 Tax=Sclerotinia borealis (strain F-4128) TaxID=1432307 RepID=W9CBH3_SCLBF|nr:hypothetical protein SBOR_6452 [Sclerotinia borealis F-4128]
MFTKFPLLLNAAQVQLPRTDQFEALCNVLVYDLRQFCIMKLQFVLFAGAVALSNASPHPTPVEVRHFYKPDLPDRGYGCNCTDTTPGPLPSSAPYLCLDWRLGPKVLPRYLPLSSELSSYNRFGGVSPGEFLAKWWNTTSQSYIYPGTVTNGFSTDINGNPINGTMILPAGTLLDRFGGEKTGTYLSSADTPYSQRSLPPSNLNDNSYYPGFPYAYHVYRVMQDLEVVGGPIAPWFGQPGLGTQFFTGSDKPVEWLIANKFLERVDLSILITNREQKGCGY